MNLYASKSPRLHHARVKRERVRRRDQQKGRGGGVGRVACRLLHRGWPRPRPRFRLTLGTRGPCRPSGTGCRNSICSACVCVLLCHDLLLKLELKLDHLWTASRTNAISRMQSQQGSKDGMLQRTACSKAQSVLSSFEIGVLSCPFLLSFFLSFVLSVFL